MTVNIKDTVQISSMSTWPEKKQSPEFWNTAKESDMGLGRIM